MLIEKGANVNAADENHNSPLIHAASHGNMTNSFVAFNYFESFYFCSYLLQKLIISMKYNTGHDNIVKMLIENGADIHAVDKDNNTALIATIYSGKIHCTEFISCKWNESLCLSTQKNDHSNT